MGIPVTAQWRHLAFCAFAVDKTIFSEGLPAGYETDLCNDTAYLLLSACLVQNAKIWKLSPGGLHSNVRVLLGACVKRKSGNQTEKGVLILHEVFKPSWTARHFGLCTGGAENLPTSFSVSFETGGKDGRGRPISDAVVEYSWGGMRLNLRTIGLPQPTSLSPLEEFLVKRPFHYSKGKTIHVEYPDWFYWDVEDYSLTGDCGSLYPEPWASQMKTPPELVFFAKGSRVDLR